MAFSAICMILDLTHFFYAFFYYPHKYIKIIKQPTKTLTMEKDFSFLRGMGTIVISLPVFISSFFILQGIYTIAIAIVFYIAYVISHLILRQNTQSSEYIKEKTVTVDMNVLLPDMYPKPYHRNITYHVPLGWDESVQRKSAVLTNIKIEKEIKSQKEQRTKEAENIKKKIKMESLEIKKSLGNQ
jgi:hypothetical protein